MSETMTTPDARLLANALKRVEGLRDLAERELQALPRKGLVHDHWRVGERGLIVRLPRASVATPTEAALLIERQAAAFARAQACAHTPALRGVVTPSADLPTGALIVEEIVGAAPRLPTDMALIAGALAALHSLPPAAETAPLANPENPLTDTLATIERNAALLARAGVPAQVQARFDAELAWARDYVAAQSELIPSLPRALCGVDTHPGNFLVKSTGFAVLVDLERMQYSTPAIDIAHASLWPSTMWDPDCGAALGRDDVQRFYRAYFLAIGKPREDALRPWLLPLRRLTWLRTSMAFARFKAEGSARLLEPTVATHARRVIDETLTLATIERVSRDWSEDDPLIF
jgi:hypothetical protein